MKIFLVTNFSYAALMKSIKSLEFPCQFFCLDDICKNKKSSSTLFPYA